MTERETVIESLMLRPLDSLINTAELLAAVVQRNGPRHADQLALVYCRDYGLPKMTGSEFLECIKSATIRKSLLVDSQTEMGQIIYGAGNVH